MSDHSSTMTENSMMVHCLDFSRQLIANNKALKFEVKLSSRIAFNFDNLDQEPTKSRKEEVKTKSSSTLKKKCSQETKMP